jgi:hypothetical protein
MPESLRLIPNTSSLMAHLARFIAKKSSEGNEGFTSLGGTESLFASLPSV